MTVFYHISTDILHSGDFEPRIPSCRHKEQEDATIPRVSVAPTIEDCLTAIPNGGSHLDELNMEQRGYYLVYRIDTEKLGISNKDIVSSDELYQKDLVRDADITNEVWITTSFNVPKEDQFLIKLVSWEESVHDILPYSICEIADNEYEGDYLEAYRDIYKEFVPSSIGITDADYIHENVKTEDEISLYFDDEEEMDLIEEYLKENYSVEITDKSMDEITFVMKEDDNLRNLFLYHKRIVDLW